MIRATRLLHTAAGTPDPRKPTEDCDADCYWCGEQTTRGCRVKKVFGSSFTDQDSALVPDSMHVCPACTWAFTGKPPDTLRLWSTLAIEGRKPAPSHEKSSFTGFHCQNKADPSEFWRVLRDPPSGMWCCAIAESGQIHTAPFAALNSGRGRWVVRFEREDVTSTPEQFRVLSDAVRGLMDAGHSKRDIESGDPHPGRIRKLGLEEWFSRDRILAPHRGGATLRLAVFLARKEKR